MSADPSHELHRVWQRVQAGAPTAVFGRLPDPPPELHLLRVSCDVAPAELRPLLEARRRAEAILDESQPLLDQARERVVSGLRRRLLGEGSDRATEAVFVEAWNNLAKQTGHPWALVFEAIEAADAATLATLGQIVRRPGWLQLPLVLVFRGEPEGAAAELLATLRAHAGEDAVVRGEAAGAAVEARVEWRTLPPAVLRVLRAGALVGPGFEVEVVAALLGQGAVEVLERLQEAADLGVPVEDRGDGRFSLPSEAIVALSRSILPSLAQAWHRRLGQLLSARGSEAEEAPPPVLSGEAGERRAPEVRREEPDVAIAEPERPAAPEPAAEPAVERGAPEPAVVAERGGLEDSLEGQVVEDRSEKTASTDWSPEAVFASAPVEPAAVEAATEAAAEELAEEAAAEREAARTDMSARTGPVGQEFPVGPVEPVGGDARGGFPGPEARGGPSRSDTGADPLIDAVRAAEHLRMAGELEAAAERYTAAARAAVEAGAPQAGAQHARRALALLARLPASPGRRRLRVRALMELGRVQWQSVGPGLGSTLAEALATLEAARQEVGQGDPVVLYAELCQAIAGVCFDLGDLRSLERSLEELGAASRALHAAGDATAAARLLNDQAAVFVRMGDPVRALHLLRESRRVFEASTAADPVVLRELAETDHLFARIPLHAQLRPGREQDGYSMGLDHALSAERAYRALGDNRELARVWETMGRLELQKKRLDRATQRLQAALEVQMQLGDLTGLARTTEALSEVLAAGGRDAEALTLLRDSVLFNREKGSPLGLAFNRRSFLALARRASARQELAPSLTELADLLDAGEGELGALRLPGEGD